MIKNKVLLFSHFLCLFWLSFVQFLEKRGPDFGKDFQTKRDFFQTSFFKMAQFLEIFSWEKLRGIDSEFRGLSIPHTFRKFYRAVALSITFVLSSHTIDFKSPSQPQAKLFWDFLILSFPFGEASLSGMYFLSFSDSMPHLWF